MPATRTPAKFYAARCRRTAAAAPAPVRLERMIHFIPPHNAKIRARLPETIAMWMLLGT